MIKIFLSASNGIWNFFCPENPYDLAAAEGGGGPVDLTFPLVCVFTVWLEPILSKTAERNQTKEPARHRSTSSPHHRKILFALFILRAPDFFFS